MFLLRLILIFISFHALNSSEIQNGQYQRFVSIGMFCLTKFQISRHLVNKYVETTDSTWIAKERLEKEKIFGGNQLFDWCNIRKISLFSDLLNSNFDMLFSKNYLSINRDHGFVWNEFYQISFDHFFTKQKFDTEPVWRVTNEIFEKEYDERNKKFIYLLEKFKNLKNVKTLYVRHSICSESIEDMEQLRVALFNFRGNENFSILNVFYEDKENYHVNSPQLFFKKIFPGPDNDHHHIGDYKSWDDALSSFIFSQNDIAPSENALNLDEKTTYS